MSDKIRVLVVDDSALMRKILTDILNADPRLTVVDTAADPYVAREKIKLLNPDVLTLDIEMPRMDGLTFLRNLMRLRPMPVVMISSLTQQGASATLEALSIGAVDFVGKPQGAISRDLVYYGREIAEKVVVAAGARVGGRPGRVVRAIAPPAAAEDSQRYGIDQLMPAKPAGNGPPLVVMGASTGGTEALRVVLSQIPTPFPPVCIVQHIPKAFSGSFAQRLDQSSALRICEAVEGQAIEPNCAYVAPGDAHLYVELHGGRYRARLSQGVPINRHRPSADVLFRSAVQTAGANAFGVLLTGMGDDGAVCLAELRQCGAPTIAQDEASSVVWGMPGAAVRLNGASHVTALGAVASQLVGLVKNRR